MPALCARYDVAATVVAPVSRLPVTGARSRTLTLTTPSSSAIRTSASSESPTRTTPSTMATVAGTAPSRRTAPSISRAVAAADSVGSPWLMIVDSRATTPTPDAIASDTSPEI
jgi:hypothetical protein